MYTFQRMSIIAFLVAVVVVSPSTISANNYVGITIRDLKENGGLMMKKNGMQKEERLWYQMEGPKQLVRDDSNGMAMRTRTSMTTTKSAPVRMSTGNTREKISTTSQKDSKGTAPDPSGGKGMMMGMGKGMGMGMGMGMMTGKGKFCKNFNFDDDDDNDEEKFYGKGMGVGKGMRMGMSKGMGMRMRMGMGKGIGGGDDNIADCSPTVFEEASTISNISTFVSLLQITGIDDIFDCSGPFTMLAPDDTAFNQTVTNFFQDPENYGALTDILLYHILPGLTLTDDFSNGTTDTLLHNNIISVTTNPITFNDVAFIGDSNISACNGAIQVINDILFPEGFLLLPGICPFLDFSSQSDRRRLQQSNDGALCDPNILDTILLNDDLSTFALLLEIAELEDIFKCPGPFTCFVPTNDALAALGTETIDFLLQPDNLDILQSVLLYHLLPNITLADEFEDGSIDTLLFMQTIDVSNGLINGNEIIDGDNFACNGVFHVLDNALVPPNITLPSPAPSTSSVPSNTPEPTPPTSTIDPTLGSVVPTVSPNLIPDICSNLDFSSDRRRLQNGGELCDPNILETMKLSNDLTTFVELLELSEVSEIFLCAGPFTCFAPTNDAFLALGQDVLDLLMDPSNLDVLQSVLLYHLVPNVTLEEDFEDGQIGTLLFDQNITVLGGLINGNEIIDADVLACNGVIHTLGSVLLPDVATSPPSIAPSVSPAGSPIFPSVTPMFSPSSIPTISHSPATSLPPSAIPMISPSSLPTDSPVTSAPGSTAPSKSPVPVPAPTGATTAPVTIAPGTTPATSKSPVPVPAPTDTTTAPVTTAPGTTPAPTISPVPVPAPTGTTTAPVVTIAPGTTPAPTISPVPVPAPTGTTAAPGTASPVTVAPV